MENILKGTRHLVDVDQSKIHDMEQAALLLWQQHRVQCRIFNTEDKNITIGITQANKPDGQYLDKKELIKIAHDTFDRFLPGKKIVIHASPYLQSPALKVDPAWIKKKMVQHGIKLKDISTETGQNYSRLSALIGGTVPLSDVMKALLYFYFLSKENEK